MRNASHNQSRPSFRLGAPTRDSVFVFFPVSVMRLNGSALLAPASTGAGACAQLRAVARPRCPRFHDRPSRPNVPQVDPSATSDTCGMVPPSSRITRHALGVSWQMVIYCRHTACRSRSPDSINTARILPLQINNRHRRKASLCAAAFAPPRAPEMRRSRHVAHESASRGAVEVSPARDDSDRRSRIASVSSPSLFTEDAN
jgi:hypothetical protein